MRIGRLAREIGVQPSSIIGFLEEEVSPINSNTKLDEELVQKVIDKFAPEFVFPSDTDTSPAEQEADNTDASPVDTEEVSSHDPEPSQVEQAIAGGSEEVNQDIQNDVIEVNEDTNSDESGSDTTTQETSDELSLEPTEAEPVDQMATTLEVNEEEENDLEASEDSSESEEKAIEETALEMSDKLIETTEAEISGPVIENVAESEADLSDERVSDQDQEELNLEGIEDQDDLSRPELHALAGAEVIRAPKVSLPGVKVLGKIDLPEPKQPEPKAEEETNQDEPQKEERKPKRKSKSKKQDRNPIARKREREQREKERQKQKQLKQQKKERTEHYQQQLEKAKSQSKIKTKKKKPVNKKVEQEKLNPFKRFIKWLNS